MERTKTPVMIMMCGLPGSGKSFYANKIKESFKDVEIFSSDQIRQELLGDESCQDNGDLVFRTLHNRIKKRLEEGGNCIYDACNINYKRRMAFLKEIEKYNPTNICIVVCEPFEVCVEQNNNRERKVPYAVIERMYKNFYLPQSFEKWDKIIILNKNNDVDPYNEMISKLAKMPHDNYHHALSIGNHILKTAEHAVELSDKDNNIVFAALLHDIGKPFVKSFVNSAGEKTEEAHYYQHDLISAYMAIPYLLKNLYIRDVIEIITMITFHMYPYFWKSEKTAEKYKKLWGENLYDKIMILHEADKMAH